jgi:hypothetical protein
MTLARDNQRVAKKRLHRKLYNLGQKVVKAEKRRLALVELGKTVVTTYSLSETEKNEDGTPKQIAHYEFPPEPLNPAFNIPAHIFVGEKMRKTHFLTMRNRPGNKELHAEAIVEDASRTFTKACDAAMSVPAINGEPLTQE